MKVSLCVLSCAALAAAKVPLYKQCDRRWGSLFMGVKGKIAEDDTICDQGCAMSSVSMALSGLGLKIDGEQTTPGSLNAWLQSNSGYTCIGDDCCNLVLAAPDRLPGSPLKLIGENPKPPAYVLRQELLADRTVFVAHVRNNSHFVLLTGSQSDSTFEVNDPFYNKTSYEYDDISDVISYSIRRDAISSRFGARGAGEGSAVGLQGTGGEPNLAVAAAIAAASGPAPALISPVVPYPMPLWKQCDPLWAKDLIETQTICAVGCLMSSTSMALDGHGIKIKNSGQNYTATPGSLNAFLRAHGGYTQGNDMEENVVPKVDPSRVTWPADGMHRTNDITAKELQGLLRAGRPAIANVMKGAHFVLVKGWDAANEDTLVVNDPGFDRATYSLSGDVVGWRLFDMKF